MAKLTKNKKTAVIKSQKPVAFKNNCHNCQNYSCDIQKTSLPVMRNKVFYKITMKCHLNGKLQILNEKYEDSYPISERLLILAPEQCGDYQG